MKSGNEDRKKEKETVMEVVGGTVHRGMSPVYINARRITVGQIWLKRHGERWVTRSLRSARPLTRG